MHENRTMPSLFLIEGPVGAGKSTYARELVLRTGGVHVPLDEWFVRLFSPDRPATDVIAWYVARKQRLYDHIWQHALALLAAGTAPILELGLVQRQMRTDFYRRAHDAGVDVQVHLLDAPRALRRARVAQRNAEQGPTFSMVVPESVFEMASDMWEEPDDAELAGNRIERIAAPR
jgi:predicted kinase